MQKTLIAVRYRISSEGANPDRRKVSYIREITRAQSLICTNIEMNVVSA